ncbi:MAG: HAD hydrolase family protein, partial [Bacillota bacterium]|nr:HAD hydrolase family protein [Bacillota bacterium]
MSKRYELIAFDLDGTLGQHKTPISDKHLELLRNLKERYQLVIAGAGTCQRIYNQVREFPIDILGSYGMQQSTVALGQDGEYHLQMLRNDSVPV